MERLHSAIKDSRCQLDIKTYRGWCTGSLNFSVKHCCCSLHEWSSPLFHPDSFLGNMSVVMHCHIPLGGALPRLFLALPQMISVYYTFICIRKTTLLNFSFPLTPGNRPKVDHQSCIQLVTVIVSEMGDTINWPN